MERYMILIKSDGKCRLIRCDDGDSCRLETMQALVDGPIEVAESNLGCSFAQEPVDSIKLIVNEEGKLCSLPLNREALRLYAYNDLDVILGSALLAAVRGEELIGFSIHVCRTIEALFGLVMEEE